MLARICIPAKAFRRYFSLKLLTPLNQSHHILRRKRNIALVIAYIGTPYHGLQKNWNLDRSLVNTVEKHLEIALYNANCIRNSNYGMLKKIGWSRSSRTDSGVHAAGAVISAKLLVKDTPAYVNSELADEITRLLPSSIRVLAARRMPKRWRARYKGSCRTYEYLVPKAVLPDGEWRNLLPEFVGSFNVHNFCNSSNTDSEKSQLSFTLTPEEIALLDSAQLDILSFKKQQSLNRTLYNFTVDSIVLDSRKFWRFCLRGQSFAFNQIRLIVGSVILSAHDLLSPAVIIAALRSPLTIRMPLAPSSPLLLTYNKDSFINARDSTNLFEDCDAEYHDATTRFKEDVLYEHMHKQCSDQLYADWIEWHRNAQWLRIDHTQALHRYAEWMQVYHQSNIVGRRRILTLLHRWLPQSRPMPPSIVNNDDTQTKTCDEKTLKCNAKMYYSKQEVSAEKCINETMSKSTRESRNESMKNSIGDAFNASMSASAIKCC